MKRDFYYFHLPRMHGPSVRAGPRGKHEVVLKKQERAWGSLSSSFHARDKAYCCSVAQSCLTLCSAECQASMSFIISQSLLKLFFIELVMPSNHVVPFSFCLQSFPSSGPFLMSWLLALGGQSIGVSASASVFPVNIQD